MKNLNLYQLLVLVLGISLFLNACRPESIADLAPGTENISTETFEFDVQSTDARLASNITVKNGILVFENMDDYKSSLLALNKMSQEQRNEWELNIGFLSLRSIFESIIRAEWENSEKNPAQNHSPLYEKHLSDARIVEKIFPNGIRSYELNLFNPFYSPVLNEDGLVKIGDDLFQFTASSLKQLKNASPTQADFLVQTQKSDAQLGIDVLEMKPALAERTTRFWDDKTVDQGTETLLSLSGHFSSRFQNLGITPGPNVIFVDYMINAKSMRKDARGNWNYSLEQIELNGSSNTSVQMSDGRNMLNRQISKTYTEQVFSSDFYFLPAESGMWTAPRGYYFLNLWQLENCNWRARTRANNVTLAYIR